MFGIRMHKNNINTASQICGNDKVGKKKSRMFFHFRDLKRVTLRVTVNRTYFSHPKIQEEVTRYQISLISFSM